ncbi:hypothetical protein DB771_28315 [Burkholderia sp. AU29985]|nr:hypothetical protein EGY28_26885 [Burkholderia dolosa]PRE46043.1 hypothetical protein C6P87_20200 [Burkholderia sp. AU12872]PUA73445.1 hypothetical protein DB771_28315 [Burkholderia sp. AU29985]
MSKVVTASSSAVLCSIVLAACQSAAPPPSLPPSPETASTAVPASAEGAPIRGVGAAPQLVARTH